MSTVFRLARTGESGPTDSRLQRHDHAAATIPPGCPTALIIAGPCSAETEEQTLATCEALAREGCVDVLRAGIWKPRTQPGSFEGVGPKGLAWLAEAKRRTGLPVATEVGSARHAEQALAAGVDLLWIGARTTVNPFLVQEIADATTGSDACILIKNPMHPDVALWAGAVARFEQAGIPRERIGLIHRGFSTGTHGRYRNDPMWHLAFDMQSRFPGMMMLGDPPISAARGDTSRRSRRPPPTSTTTD